MKKRRYYVQVEEVSAHQTIGSLIRKTKKETPKKEGRADRYILRFKLLDEQINKLLTELRRKINLSKGGGNG